MEYTDEMLNEIVEQRVLEEVKQGIQIIQYQVTTLMTTNGQAPFITVFMYLGEVEEVNDMREAVNSALYGSLEKTTVIFSPASDTSDMESEGRSFRHEVDEL